MSINLNLHLIKNINNFHFNYKSFFIFKRNIIY